MEDPSLGLDAPAGPTALAGIRARLIRAATERGLALGRNGPLTGVEIAELSGVSQAVWSGWTREKAPSEPGIVRLAAVAKALRISLDWLVYGDEHVGMLNESLIEDLRSVMKLDPKKQRKERRKKMAMLVRRRIYPIVSAILFGSVTRRVRPVSKEEMDKIEPEVRAIWEACAPQEALLWDRLIEPWTKRVDARRSSR